MALQVRPRPDTDKVIYPATVNEFCKYDLIVRVLYRLSKTRSWPLALLSLIIYLIFLVGQGWLISVQNQTKGLHFIGIFAPSETVFALFTYLVYSPLIWLFYSWQPRELLRIIPKLEANGVLILEDRNVEINIPIDGPLWRRLVMHIVVKNGLWTEGLIFLITLVGAFGYVWLFLPPQGAFAGTENLYYFQMDGFYFASYLVLIFLNVYMLLWIIARQIRVCWILAHVLHPRKIVLKLFFSDQCNGFSPIGQFATRSSLIALLFSIWLLLIVVDPRVIGQPANILGHLLLILLGYVASILILFLPLAVITHQSMEQAKALKLDEVATELQQQYLIEKLTQKPILEESKEYVQELERRYQTLEKEYHTWPFRSGFVVSYGVPVLLPVALALLAAVLKP